MSTGALSLFGDAYEPADPPATDRCPACAGPSPKGRTCARCKAAGIELAPASASCPAPHHGPASAAGCVGDCTEPALTPTQEHRARCDGPLMAPIFGLGRTSCAVCDWSPSDGQ